MQVLCIMNNSIKLQSFVYIQLNVKTVLFQTIQFSINTQFSSVWPIDSTLSGTSTLGLRRPGSDVSKGVLCIPQSSKITGLSQSDCLVSYLGHSLGESYLSAEMQSVYSADQANWVSFSWVITSFIWFVCLFGFYGISTFEFYLMPNQFHTNKQFYFKQFSLASVHSFIFKTISISSNSV